MLSAWDACEECDEVIQKAARGDLPHPQDGLKFGGGIAATVGAYSAFYALVFELLPIIGVLSALAIAGGFTTVAVQSLRSRRYRKAVVAGAHRSSASSSS